VICSILFDLLSVKHISVLAIFIKNRIFGFMNKYKVKHLPDRYPQRIICLTEEFTEILYLLGEQDRIAGISVYTVRPKVAKNEKPMVCDFTGVNMEKINAIKPDLILGFSDVQAEVARQLIKSGYNVLIFNQRSIADILQTVLLTGSLVGKASEATELVMELERDMEAVSMHAEKLAHKPMIYFEEWYSPLISCIRWVSELITIAGGRDCFEELSHFPDAKRRMISNEAEVIRRNPDIIIASWCGKRFLPKKIYSRTGWNGINAIQTEQVHEIDSALILQPGPAALSDGLASLHHIIKKWSETR
jgi:iron complex transport system substrate-binding protein